MNRNKIPGARCFFKSGLIFLCLLCCLVGTCRAGNYLEQKAFPSKAPAQAALMDITRTGDRLVAVGERGIIIYSDDQGQSWKQARVPVRVTLTAVYFSSPDNGWAVGHETVALHSRDHGETWEKVIDGRKVNDLMVAAMGKIVKDKQQQLEQAPEVEKVDLRQSLEDAETNLKGFQDTSKEGPTQPWLDVFCAGPDQSLLLGAFGMLLNTADGGRTWTPELDRISNPMGYHFYSFSRTRDAWFIFGEAGGLYRSDDAGRHWENLESPYEGSFFSSLGAVDGSLIMGFGLRGNLIISRDNGQNWRHLQLGAEALCGATILSGDYFVIVSMGNSIYIGRVSQAGIRRLDTGFPACLAVADAGDGYVVLAGLKGVKRMKVDFKAGKEVK